MSARIIHDIFGRPTIEIDDEKQVVTALRDCTINLSAEAFMRDGTKYEVEFIVEERKDS